MITKTWHSRSAADRLLLERASALASEAHEGHLRESGEPYICHLVATATQVARMHGDAEMIAAALLHDSLENTWFSARRIERLGRQITRLVVSVSEPNFKWIVTGRHYQERWLDAAWEMGKPAIILKLADRLHNMHTLDALPLYRQQAIGRETLVFFVPLAAACSLPGLSENLATCARRTLLHDPKVRILELAEEGADSNSRRRCSDGPADNPDPDADCLHHGLDHRRGVSSAELPDALLTDSARS